MPTVILHMANPLFCFMANTPYVSSEEGSQHEDPVGPLLFCNTIQPLLTSLDSDLNLGYLDDVYLTCLLVAQLMWSPPMLLKWPRWVVIWVSI